MIPIVVLSVLVLLYWGSGLPANIQLDIDGDRETERIYSLFNSYMSKLEKMQGRLRLQPDTVSRDCQWLQGCLAGVPATTGALCWHDQPSEPPVLVCGTEGGELLSAAWQLRGRTTLITDPVDNFKMEFSCSL